MNHQNEIRKTEVLYTDSNHNFRGLRHAIVGTQICDDGDEDQEQILTLQIDGQIFYATGKTGTHIQRGLLTLELEAYGPNGQPTGNRVWIDNEAACVWAD